MPPKKINKQNIRKIEIEGKEYFVYLRFNDDATDQQKKEFEALILECLKLLIPTDKKDERKAELLKKTNLTEQEDKELLTLVKEIENNRNILREQTNKKKFYSNSPFPLFDYDYQSDEYDSDDNESDIFFNWDETDDEEENEDEQPETSEKALTRLKNQTESNWWKITEARKLLHDDFKLKTLKTGEERINEEMARHQNLLKSAQEKQIQQRYSEITEEEEKALIIKEAEPRNWKPTARAWSPIAFSPSWATAEYSEQKLKEYAIWKNQPILTAYEKAAQEERALAQKAINLVKDVLRETENLQLSENEYKTKTEEIIKAAAMESENKQKTIDTLTERLTAAEQQKNELVKERTEREQSEKAKKEQDEAAAQKLKSQLEKPAIQSTDDTNARKLAEYDQIIKETKDKDAKIEAYELKIFTLLADYEVKGKAWEKEKTELLLNWQISHKQSTAKTHEISEKNARIDALSLEKAALENKEIGYKGDIELLQKQKSDLENTQLNLRQQIEAKNKEIKAEIDKKRKAEDQRDQLENETHTLKNDRLKEQREHRETKDRAQANEDRLNNEKTELARRLEQYEPKGLMASIGRGWKSFSDFTGLSKLWSGFSNMINLLGFVVFLLIALYVYTYLIKPVLSPSKKKSKKDQDDDNENEKDETPRQSPNQPPHISPVLSIENTRELTSESSKNEPEKNSEINEKNHEPTPAKKKSKKRKKNKDTPH